MSGTLLFPQGLRLRIWKEVVLRWAVLLCPAGSCCWELRHHWSVGVSGPRDCKGAGYLTGSSRPGKEEGLRSNLRVILCHLLLNTPAHLPICGLAACRRKGELVGEQ